MEASATPAGAGLDTCACKRGFFTLRDCENPATATCDICSRRVCDKHLAPRVGATVCVECAAKQEEEGVVTPAGGKPSGKQPAQPIQSEEDVTYQAARYRSSYYRNYGYEPMWWGTYDPYWSGYGYRWYDDPNDDDDDGGGFGDS